MIVAFSIFQLASITLMICFLFLIFKLAETNWSYKISKPYAWEEAVTNGRISKPLRKMEKFCRDKVRFYTIWFQIERLKKEGVSGAFAEVGVYRGETAKMIHEMDQSRPLHLFDTFAGFEKKDLEFENVNHPNYAIDFSDTTVESVSKFISGNSNINIHKGYFPSSTKNIDVEEYAFVHLDADLYHPTLSGLQYFYPRLAEGGIIIIHDYNHTWEGVAKAVNEFNKTIPENFIAIADWLGSVIMVKNKRIQQ